MNLLLCLPPKCGTTNYQKALAPLEDGFVIGSIFEKYIFIKLLYFYEYNIFLCSKNRINFR